MEFLRVMIGEKIWRLPNVFGQKKFFGPTGLAKGPEARSRGGESSKKGKRYSIAGYSIAQDAGTE